MPSVDGVALVDHVKSLGIIFQQSLPYDLHVTYVVTFVLSFVNSFV